jgi:protoporphyrinogen oxidase
MSARRQSGKVAVIAGAGPAGLTAALEMLRRSDVSPIVFDSGNQVGGISRTVNYRGNRMDLGGHRFFSKSDWVMRWWQEILPVEEGESPEQPLRMSYQGQHRDWIPGMRGHASSDSVLLVRQRLSRIFYRRRFFDYPLKINFHTLRNMGPIETIKTGMSYAQARLAHRSPEVSLEDFLINRFGDRLYRTFFKSYTEKVWGVPCEEISAEWGAQRIKGLSVTKAIMHAFKAPFRSSADTAQKRIETSLVERFLYPKFGPGQMWEEVARRVCRDGGSIHLNHRVVAIDRTDDRVTSVHVRDCQTGSVRTVACDFFVSTMPLCDLVSFLKPADVPLLRVAQGLPYRDFMTAGLLLRKMTLPPDRRNAASENGMPPDNWIYVQEPDVRLGRLQVFNNWSPSMVADPRTIWLGLEYFCREGDDLWSMTDGRFIDFAARELARLGMIALDDVIDGTVVRVPKAYPAYFGEYKEIDRVRDYLDRFANLYAVGRNGMHRYNNQDHSMLAANSAVRAILDGGAGKSDIWLVNTEDEYHEDRAENGAEADVSVSVLQ